MRELEEPMKQSIEKAEGQQGEGAESDREVKDRGWEVSEVQGESQCTG